MMPLHSCKANKINYLFLYTHDGPHHIICWCSLCNLQLPDLSLTHWGRDKMVSISQTNISNAFSWIKKIYEFPLIFYWSLFQGTELTIFQHFQIMAWCRLGAKPLSEPMIDYWRMYASLGLNKSLPGCVLLWCVWVCACVRALLRGGKRDGGNIESWSKREK